MSNLTVRWVDHEREPQCEPDPHYPNGKDIDISAGAPAACQVALPYPAKRCGIYMVECDVCRQAIGVTTAGRPDDPRSLKIACRTVGATKQ